MSWNNLHKSYLRSLPQSMLHIPLHLLVGLVFPGSKDWTLMMDYWGMSLKVYLISLAALLWADRAASLSSSWSLDFPALTFERRDPALDDFLEAAATAAWWTAFSLAFCSALAFLEIPLCGIFFLQQLNDNCVLVLLWQPKLSLTPITCLTLKTERREYYWKLS